MSDGRRAQIVHEVTPCLTRVSMGKSPSNPLEDDETAEGLCDLYLDVIMFVSVQFSLLL